MKKNEISKRQRAILKNNQQIAQNLAIKAALCHRRKILTKLRTIVNTQPRIFYNHPLLGGASGTLSLNMANANSWTALQTFQNASSSLLSAYTAYFGGTGTTTITNAGYIGVGTTSPYAPLSVVGQIVGSYFTATTSATSTFPTSLS